LSLALSLLMLFGCTVKLPPKVDYTIDENTKPEIDQIQEGALNQATFEIKIDEIKSKASLFIASDSAKTSIIEIADSLLARQQRYYLKNGNMPYKAANTTGKVGSIAFVGGCIIGSMIFAAQTDGDYGPGPLLFVYGLLIYPMAYAEFWIAGGAVGLLFQGKMIKPKHKRELQKLVADYNAAVKDRLK